MHERCFYQKISGKTSFATSPGVQHPMTAAMVILAFLAMVSMLAHREAGLISTSHDTILPSASAQRKGNQAPFSWPPPAPQVYNPFHAEDQERPQGGFEGGWVNDFPKIIEIHVRAVRTAP